MRTARVKVRVICCPKCGKPQGFADAQGAIAYIVQIACKDSHFAYWGETVAKWKTVSIPYGKPHKGKGGKP